MERANAISFTAEATLGKLAKWLRILGFDTLYLRQTLSRESVDTQQQKRRVLLTRTERIRDQEAFQPLIFIRSDHPFAQLEEVIQALNLVAADIKPFSRCVRCNTPVASVEKDAVRGKVPDYIWETHDTFQTCRPCRKIFWAGSHIRQSYEIISRLFGCIS